VGLILLVDHIILLSTILGDRPHDGGRRISKTSIKFCQITRCNIPGHSLHACHRENIKFPPYIFYPYESNYEALDCIEAGNLLTSLVIRKVLRKTIVGLVLTGLRPQYD
jgi:hypothetical protein